MDHLIRAMLHLFVLLPVNSTWSHLLCGTGARDREDPRTRIVQRQAQVTVSSLPDGDRAHCIAMGEISIRNFLANALAYLTRLPRPDHRHRERHPDADGSVCPRQRARHCAEEDRQSPREPFALALLQDAPGEGWAWPMRADACGGMEATSWCSTTLVVGPRLPSPSPISSQKGRRCRRTVPVTISTGGKTIRAMRVHRAELASCRKHHQ